MKNEQHVGLEGRQSILKTLRHHGHQWLAAADGIARLCCFATQVETWLFHPVQQPVEAQRLKLAQEQLQEKLQQDELQLEELPQLLVGHVLACGRATDLYRLLAE